MTRTLVLSGLLMSVGCSSAPDTPIVTLVRQAGAGNVGAASEESLRTWFAAHVNVASKIRPMCFAAMKGASATWGDSAEGRVCRAGMLIGGFGSQKDLPPLKH